jgi:hypothetical protein
MVKTEQTSIAEKRIGYHVPLRTNNSERVVSEHKIPRQRIHAEQ